MKSVLLLCLALIGCSPIVQRPFETSERHAPREVMGRDFWIYLCANPYTDPIWKAKKDVWQKPWYNLDLTDEPVFNDCGLIYTGVRPPPDARGLESCWSTVRDHFPAKSVDWESLESNAVSNRPIVMVFSAKRNVLAMSGEVHLDKGDWLEFKRKHPNLLGVRAMAEWGNDQMLQKSQTKNVPNASRRAELEAVWNGHRLDDRNDRMSLCRWFRDRALKIHYDDLDSFIALRSAYGLDHVAAAWGACALAMETTNTTNPDAEYRWDVASMFVRGASRQFQLPWCWYVAIYYNGPRRDGSIMKNSVCYYMPDPKQRPFPEGGVSASAQRRAFYYAYLNGANGVEPESVNRAFFTTNTPSGKVGLSVRGKNFSDFYDFTRKNPDRGTTYAPVAVLVPFGQGYTAYGGRAWGLCGYTDGDYAVDSVFFTISPGWKRAEGIQVGNSEGNLHNSRFAMMYDVLVPDSPQPKEEFKRVLFGYPAAVLVGDYPNPEKFADVLEDYQRAGGRLVRITNDMLPPRRADKRDDRLVREIYRGERRFPEVEKRLEALQERLFPFEVRGDVQYGANRTKDGWWLWVFNNKGIVKFADTFEEVDHSKDAPIVVRALREKAIKVTELMSGSDVEVEGGRFEQVIPAGEFAIYSVKQK